MDSYFHLQRLLVIIFLVLFTVSCKKHDTHSSGNWLLSLPGNRELKSSVIKTLREQRNGYQILSAFENTPNPPYNILHFWFSKWPSASMNYTVVHYLKLQGGLQPNEMAISVDYPSMPSIFFSTGLKYVGYSDQSADPIFVSVVDDKIQISIPQMSLYDTVRTYDSAYIQGTIREN
jgi:hypothetical protein